MKDTILDEALSEVPNYILKCPVFMNWTEYKGETYFGVLNYERSIKARRAMIDLCYCATKGLHGNVIKTVAYNRNKFKPSSLDSL